MKVNIDAIFKFMAKNPPSIAIAGAILMWIIAAFMKGAGLQGGNQLDFWAPFVFIGGCVLQIYWLLNKK
jgi:hypothetical protein